MEVFVDEEEGSVFEAPDDHWGKSDAMHRRLPPSLPSPPPPLSHARV